LPRSGMQLCLFLLFSFLVCVRFLTQILFLHFCVQIIFGSMESETCVLLHMGICLEEHLQLHPGAKCLFTPDLDTKAPDRLKSNHRNNLDCHVLHVNEFQEFCDDRSWVWVLILGAREQQTRQGAKRHSLMRLKFGEGGSHRAVELHSGASMPNSSTLMPRLLARFSSGVLSSTNSRWVLKTRSLMTGCSPAVCPMFVIDLLMTIVFVKSLDSLLCSPAAIRH